MRLASPLVILAVIQLIDGASIVAVENETSLVADEIFLGSSSNTSLPEDEKAEFNYARDTIKKTVRDEQRFECGRQIIRNGRIVGGENAYEGEFPWAVSIRLNGQHYCGGVLLNKRWILTAAHCVVGYVPRNFLVRLGVHRTRRDLQQNEQDIAVHSMIIHQNYSRPRPFANDIALLKLQHEAQYSDHVVPVCLPERASTELGDFYQGLPGIVVGWGWIKDAANTGTGRGEAATVLQKVLLPVIGNEECSGWYAAQGKHVVVSSQQFCAGFKLGGKDACRGDSGGPMLTKNAATSRYSVIGIVSAGIGCALKQLPGLYTRVNAYIPWIENYIT